MAGIEHVTSRSFTAHLPYDFGAAASARRLVADFLKRRLHPANALIDDATLVVHELVVNGLEHGAPDDHDRIEVSGRITDGAFVISVLDQGRGGTVAAQPVTEDREHGRGLALVAALSSSWSVERSSGTRVSARLSL